MSKDILEIAHLGLDQMKQHPRNYLDGRIRREIYNLLNVNSTLHPDRRHQSLAILAAEYVLPLYQPTGLDDRLVYQLLEAARAFTQNETDVAKVDEIEEAGYNAAQWFGYDFEKDQWHYQSAHAGFAAYKALVEARHLIDPWDGIERLSKSDGVHRVGGEPHPEGWTVGAEFTDDDWCNLATFGDTASAAAFAYATSADVDECLPEKLRDFWEWWVSVALPKALQVPLNAA